MSPASTEKPIPTARGLPDAQWIGMPAAARGRAAPLFRRVFTMDGEAASARLNVCGLGFYEAWINGRRVGDRVLDPAQTDYTLRCFYVKYDVTEHLHSGPNAMGVMLGDGFFNQDIVWKARYQLENSLSYGEPRLTAELAVQLKDGREIRIRTDGEWRCATGPVLSSNVYAGERYDARLEEPGWDTPDFDDSSWEAVEIVASPGGRLEPQDMPPIKAIEEIKPVSIREVGPGCSVVDMGQNFAGWARIRVKAQAGTTVRLRFAESLGPDGMIDTASTGVFATGVEQEDTYTCRGEGVETWEPRFTYHGFRYIEVNGWPGVPMPDDIVGVVVHTGLPKAGGFECSDERLNRLHRMALWTHRSNIHGLPTDCPARERCGWLGDAHIVCEYSIYNFRGMRFWEKHLDDIETARELNGGLPPNIAPGKRRCGTAKPDWMAALILIPWYLYVYYGRRQVLDRHWEGMRTVIEHFRERSENWLLRGGYGDWCDPLEGTKPTYTPEALTTTIWFRECARICSQVANLLGHSQAGTRYVEWMPAIEDAFRRRWYDAAGETFGSQTADAMALHFGLAPEGREAAVARSLARDITATRDMHHTVGIMGLRYLFEVLTRHGYGAIALALMRQNSFPSFGDLIQRGATTLWEYWGEDPATYKEQPRSLNHPMMGGFDNWFFNTLAGILPDPEQPGFRHIRLEPRPIPGLAWVRAHHDCPHGRIESAWRVERGRFLWNIVIPPGACATAVLPYTRRIHALAGISRTTLEDPVRVVHPPRAGSADRPR